MYCPKCGKEVAEESKFCSFCGSSVNAGINQADDKVIAPKSVADQTVKCTKCKQKVVLVNGKCPSCGAKNLPRGCQVAGGCAILIFLGVVILIVLASIFGDSNKAEITKTESRKTIQQKVSSSFWGKENNGPVPYLTATRLFDSESNGDVVRITAGLDSDHGIFFQFPGKHMVEGFSYSYKPNEPVDSGYSFFLNDGKNTWMHFKDSDTNVTLHIRKIDYENLKVSFNIKGFVRNGLPDPKNESSFAQYIPGKEKITFDLDVSVWGTDFSKIIRQTVDYQNLRVGAFYRLEKDTVLAPELDPKDPMAAIRKMKKLSPGVIIKILYKTNKQGTIWYQVDVYSGSSRKLIAAGWINSTGLVSQDLIQM